MPFLKILIKYEIQFKYLSFFLQISPLHAAETHYRLLDLYYFTYEKEIPFGGNLFLKNQLTVIRLVYLFVGHGKKIGKFPCS
jgi:hypothetical protein